MSPGSEKRLYMLSEHRSRNFKRGFGEKKLFHSYISPEETHSIVGESLADYDKVKHWRPNEYNSKVIRMGITLHILNTQIVFSVNIYLFISEITMHNIPMQEIMLYV